MRTDRARHDRGSYSAASHLCVLAVLFWSLLACSLLANGQQVVTYPRPESSKDSRASYPVALLTMCAKNSRNGFVVRPSDIQAQQGRAIRQLSLGQGLDVVWAVTNDEREHLLLPIRIPIDRGLIGWRLLLIRDRDAGLFDAISTPAQLAALRAGQGHDWPDVDVLRANGFELSTSTTYEGLFHMLALGHIQYFPRSISEIWSELDKHPNMGIGVQKTLIVHYPEALYFFVNKSNTALADALTACLRDATNNGSLQALFNAYYRESIQRSDLAHRTVINLGNPLLPRETPTSTGVYWFSPMEAP